MRRGNKKRSVGLALTAIMTISLFAALTVPVYAAEGDITRLEEIQKAIEESGAEWQAGNTSVSGLSFEEKQQLCGLKIRRYTKDLGREGEQKVMGAAKDPNAKTAEGISRERIHHWTAMLPFASPGEVITSWTATNSWVWGVGFDGSGVWISDPVELVDYEYTTTGTYISSFNTPWAGNNWSADFAWDGSHLWQVNVGGDNCIYELDPANGNVLSTICDPDGIWNWTSQRGLAYDAATDTFYVGGWNDGIVYHIQGPTRANPGKIIDQFTPPDSARVISGLALAPDGTLWIGTNSDPDMLYQIDLTTHHLIQCLPHPEWQTWSNAAGGLACDAAGDLWMVSQATKTVYHVDTTPAYPDAFDWRDYGGDWTTPIKDQGQCGSCWAFGSLCSMESCINIQKGDSTIDKDLSEQYLLSCSAGSCEYGWYFDSTLNYLRDTGTVDEACFPYQANDTIPCNAACDDADCRTWQITDWDWVPPSTSEIQGHLLDAPIVTGMPVYEDFKYYQGGIYEHVWGDLSGYHMVNMVGYNDTEHYWICKNSWNTTWGENGWFRIRYGECEIETWNAYIVPPIKDKPEGTICGYGGWEDDPANECKERREILKCVSGTCTPSGEYDYQDKPDGTICGHGDWEDDPANPCKERREILKCVSGTCSPSGEYEYQNKPDGTNCGHGDWGDDPSNTCKERREINKCSGGFCLGSGSYEYRNKADGTVCGYGSWEDDPSNTCKERREILKCVSGTCTPSGEYEYQNKPDGTICGYGEWEADPVNPCKERREILKCVGETCSPSGEYEYQNKSDGTICGCRVNNTLKKCYEGLCSDTGICNSTICGADSSCDGKKPGESCGTDRKCDSTCNCVEIIIFDTGAPANPYPSIMGTHNGTIKPNQTITVQKLYTYPCSGTSGHTEHVRIWTDIWIGKEAHWKGYKDDWHNITFDEPFTLFAEKTYNYEIRTGSYPQIIHKPEHTTLDGSFINCTNFIDANGKEYTDWIPAIRLWS